jgi:hypothetical protein
MPRKLYSLGPTSVFLAATPIPRAGCSVSAGERSRHPWRLTRRDSDNEWRKDVLTLPHNRLCGTGTDSESNGVLRLRGSSGDLAITRQLTSGL